jgi:hypothetical protein
MSTASINATTDNATTERPHTLRSRMSAVPWLTVVPLAVVLAYADGFWMISLRGAVGAIERTDEPFATWLRESTLALPVFVLAVFGALTLAARRFGPVLRKPKTVVATALMIVAAGTLVSIVEVAASSAYDYKLQSDQLQQTGSMRSMGSMHSMGSMGSMHSMGSMGSTHSMGGSMDSTAHQQQASLGLQVRAVSYGSGILLVTNLVLVGWVVAMRGGSMNVSTTRQRAARALPQPGT